MAKIAEFRDLSVDQLSESLTKLKKEQFNLRFQRASGQLENTARKRVVRRDIARVLTVLSSRGEKPVVAAAAKAAKKVVKKVVKKVAKKPAAKAKK